MSHAIRSLVLVVLLCGIAETLPAEPTQFLGLRRDFLALEAWLAVPMAVRR